MGTMIKVKYTPAEKSGIVPLARFWDKAGIRRPVDGTLNADGTRDFIIHDNDQNRSFLASCKAFWTLEEEKVEAPEPRRREQSAQANNEKNVNQMINEMVDANYDFGGANTSERKVREKYQEFLAQKSDENSESSEATEEKGKKKGK